MISITHSAERGSPSVIGRLCLSFGKAACAPRGSRPETTQLNPQDSLSKSFFAAMSQVDHRWYRFLKPLKANR